MTSNTRKGEYLAKLYIFSHQMSRESGKRVRDNLYNYCNGKDYLVESIMHEDWRFWMSQGNDHYANEVSRKRRKREAVDPRPMRYWYVYHFSLPFNGIAIESQTMNDAINLAIDYFLDMGEGFSRRRTRRIKSEFRQCGKSYGVIIEEVTRDQYLEINSD